jgi:CspA family cold shock protein
MLSRQWLALRSAFANDRGGVTRPWVFSGEQGWVATWKTAPVADAFRKVNPVVPMRGGARQSTTTGRSFPMAMTGTVKFFNGERGYGFIKPDDGGRDVFVHITAVERAGLKALNEGQRITFEVEPDKKGKGPKAVNLVISP